jgi:hypothetical protein
MSSVPGLTSAASRCLVVTWLVAGAAIVPLSRIHAQDNYEIQVYGAPLTPQGHTMFELHSNYTIEGQKTTTDGTVPSQHAIHETLEITRGLNSWSEMGFYLFSSANPGQGYQFVGTHIRPRVTAPESWKWPVGVSISQEFGWAKTKYAADDWTYELRPIIDKEMGRFYVSLNPVLGKSLHGPASSQPFAFTPQALAGMAVAPKVNLALEYYGAFGTTKGLVNGADQSHQLFYAFNYDFGSDWEFNIAYGAGLTKNVEKSMVKMIVGRRR